MWESTQRKIAGSVLISTSTTAFLPIDTEAIRNSGNTDREKPALPVISVKQSRSTKNEWEVLRKAERKYVRDIATYDRLGLQKRRLKFFVNAECEGLGHRRTFKRCLTTMFGTPVMSLMVYKWERGSTPPSRHQGGFARERALFYQCRSPMEVPTIPGHGKSEGNIQSSADETAFRKLVYSIWRNNISLAISGQAAEARRQEAWLIPGPLATLIYDHIWETSGNS